MSEKALDQLIQEKTDKLNSYLATEKNLKEQAHQMFLQAMKLDGYIDALKEIKKTYAKSGKEALPVQQSGSKKS